MSVSSLTPTSTAVSGPQVLDRLGILTILAAFYYLQNFSHWGLHLNLPIDAPRNLGYLSLYGLAIVGILCGRLYQILILLAAAHFVQYLMRMPVASNNDMMAFFFSACVIAAYLVWIKKGGEGGRDGLFNLIAGPGRWILATMYFYGIYHKINTDFLDPAVSCGTLLYIFITEPFWLDQWAFGQNAAIWTTFVAEGVAMLVLFSRGYKKIGFLVGIPFHILIGWSGYSYFLNFSSIVLVTYALFLPRDSIDLSTEWFKKVFGSVSRAAWIGWIFAIVCVFGTFAFIGAFEDWRYLRTVQPTFKWPFSIVAFLFYAYVFAFVPWRASQTLPALRFKAPYLIIIPLIYFINGFSPYLGLKTEASVAMFSNLRTEGGQTNHLIHGQLPFAADYQNDLVYISPKDLEKFTNFPEFGGDAVVRYEFDRILAKNPDMKVTFTHNGQERTNDETWENTYLASNFFLRRFLIFRTVVLDQQKQCSH